MATSSPPQFFRVFIPELYSDRLKIPSAFVEHIKGVAGPPSTVSLKGPGGSVWYTELVTNSGEFFLDKGWKEFISHHSIQKDDFLVFKYEGNLKFDVLVFDPSACEKEAALLAQPSNQRDSIREEAVVEPSNRVALKNKKKNRGMKRKKMDTDDCFVLEELSSPPPKNKFITCKEEQILVSAKRQNGFMSQRRPVTIEEVDMVLLKAQAFKSEHPFCLIQMHDSYVYVGFSLSIPMIFAREHLPRPSGNVILLDPSGTRWEVKSISYAKYGSFTAGWSKFSVANNLETGDVCVFEVIEKYEIKVHIFRVVEKLTPLIRSL